MAFPPRRSCSCSGFFFFFFLIFFNVDVHISPPRGRSNDLLVDSLAKPPEGDAPLRYEDMHVAAAPRQLHLLLGRNLRQYMRKIPYNGIRL